MLLPSRTWFTFSGVITVVVSIIAMTAIVGDRWSFAMPEEERPNECTVTFEVGDKVYVSWSTTDPDLINEYVLGPLEDSTMDADPSRYVILGTLALTYPDRVKRMTLFVPWGHVADGGEYRIADFAELRQRIERGLELQLGRVSRSRPPEASDEESP